jgi:unsaturated chondroitin disaccharide hydrolase
MKMNKLYLILTICPIIWMGCTEEETKDWNTQALDTALYQHLELAKNLDNDVFPCCEDENGSIKKVPSSSWISGFYPGSLWYLYELSQVEQYKIFAENWTWTIENEKNNKGTHDLGFMINCSFGHAYRITGNDEYKKVLITAANSLISRYNEKVGCIKSWDFFNGSDKWQQFPVIIDNLMNLELLFLATKLTGDSTYYHVAYSHAKKTMENQLREDYSQYHVVDYDTLTGNAIKKMTSQGFADESNWARGQAWGIYGFTMCYRETRNPEFLKTAKAMNECFINHPNMPDDYIPYWDFDDINIPDAPRDASAAAITASALLELQKYLEGEEKQYYQDLATRLLKNLSSDKYLARKGQNNGFVLKHSTGHMPLKKEVDVPIIYADYYYIEALIRFQDMQL